MDSYQIVRLLCRFSRIIKDFPIVVCSLHQMLDGVLSETRGYICNTGNRWVAVVVVVEDKKVFYLDSLGRDIPETLRLKMGDFKCIVNRTRVQPRGSRTCGIYAVYFLVMCIGRML